MKKLFLILGLVLVLTFVITLTATATPRTYLSGFFIFPAPPGYDFCYATGEYPVKDGFMDGCGAYITNHTGLGQTAIWDGWIGGEYGTCVIHVRLPITTESYVTVNQCTGDLAGFHLVAYGDFSSLPFTWDGYYHWENRD